VKYLRGSGVRGPPRVVPSLTAMAPPVECHHLCLTRPCHLALACQVTVPKVKEEEAARKRAIRVD
jgi:hypothetical protein